MKSNAKLSNILTVLVPVGEKGGRWLRLLRRAGRPAIRLRMPRKLKIEARGLLYHVIARGIKRRAIFKDEGDGRLVLALQAQEENFDKRIEEMQLADLTKTVADSYRLTQKQIRGKNTTKAASEARVRIPASKCTDATNATNVP